ncbi:MAG: stage III sporulation AC/AD family protein [Oscillospiraceae bacterium]
MDIFKLLVLVLVFLMMVQLLRTHNPSFAILASAACCVVLMLFSLKVCAPMFDFIRTLTGLADNESFGAVIKCVAIVLVTQMTQELCAESGQLALAGRVELAGRIAVLLCALPLFKEIMNIITGMLQ